MLIWTKVIENYGEYLTLALDLFINVVDGVTSGTFTNKCWHTTRFCIIINCSYINGHEAITDPLYSFMAVLWYDFFHSLSVQDGNNYGRIWSEKCVIHDNVVLHWTDRPQLKNKQTNLSTHYNWPIDFKHLKSEHVLVILKIFRESFSTTFNNFLLEY